MKICNGFENFKNEVLEKNKPVVCFGAGMMGFYIENLFIKDGLWKFILCFLDNDISKNGKFIGRKELKPIKTIEKFQDEAESDFVMLITCVTFLPIIQQLQKIENWKNIHCYIYSKLNYEIVSSAKYMPLTANKITQEIPKIIHYCWFGNHQLGELEKTCIETWKKYCPDYEIIEWNEKNYDISKNRYMREAYEREKWAYVSDYARLDILCQYGGIYLDTDVELLKNIDILLQNKAFIAYGEWPVVNSGAGVGSVKNNPLIEEMRDYPRKTKSFIDKNGECDITQNCIYETNILEKYGFSYNFEMQYVNEMLILPPRIIATNSVIGCDAYVTQETLAIHHNGESWANENRRIERELTRKNMINNW